MRRAGRRRFRNWLRAGPPRLGPGNRDGNRRGAAGVRIRPAELPYPFQHHSPMIRAISQDRPAKPRDGAAAAAPPSFRRERALIKRGVWPVAGCDEAGRGPLAGPVVAAAVVLDPKRIPKGIDDSKRLTPERREELFEEICLTASFAVAFGSPARIDRDNILPASLWPLARAVGALPELPQHVFVDGRDK